VVKELKQFTKEHQKNNTCFDIIFGVKPK